MKNKSKKDLKSKNIKLPKPPNIDFYEETFSGFIKIHNDKKNND